MRRLRIVFARWLGRGSALEGQNLLDEVQDLYRERRARGRLGAAWRAVWDLASLMARRPRNVSALPDLRAGIRYWRSRPGLAATAVLTLTLGLGSGVTVFAVVRGILFEPLPYPASDRLILVWNTYPSWRGDPFLGDRWNTVPLSWPEYVDVRDHSGGIEATGLYEQHPATVTLDTGAELVVSASVSASFFDLVGARVSRGRGFLREEDESPSDVVVISHELWQRLGGRRDVIGRRLQIGDGQPTVVGVLEPGAAFQGESLWRPIGLDAPDNRGRDKHRYQAIARLGTGIDPATALEELRPLLLGDRSSETMGARVESLLTNRVGHIRLQLLLILGASVLLIAIASLNVSGLIVGDFAGRGRELAVRQALGASRWQLAREVLGAELLLAGAGVVMAIAVAAQAIPAVRRFLPSNTPRVDTIVLDGQVIVMAIVAALAVTVLCSVAPLVVLAGQRWSGVLRTSGRTVVDGRRVQAGLVSGQLAITVVLLVASSVLVLTLVSLVRVDPGFRARGLVVARVLPPASTYATKEAVHELFETLAGRAVGLPGVSAVTTSGRLPFADPPLSTSIGLRAATDDGPRPEVRFHVVAPGYFGVLGIPLEAGRALAATDVNGAPDVAVVSASFGRDFFDGRPIGRQFEWNERWFTIVGVTGDMLDETLDAEVRPTFYTSAEQVTARNRWVVVRTSADPILVEAELARLVRSVDARIVVSRLTDLPSLLARTLEHQRFRMTLMSVFAVLAALLSFVSIHAAIARTVTEGRREIGVRLALGADRRDIAWLLVRQAGRLVVWGVGIGAVASVAASRILGSMLFGVAPSHPAVIALVAGVVVVLVAAATVLPARRALAVDPVVVMKEA